jgi:hypothetical protein
MSTPNLTVSHDEAHGFWTGRGWLVIDADRPDEPAVAAFKTDAEAFDYVDAEREDADDARRELAREVPNG